MIKYQSAARSFIRKDAEIDAAIHNGRPERKDLAGAILKISKLMGRKCVYSLHIVSPYAGFFILSGFLRLTREPEHTGHHDSKHQQTADGSAIYRG